MLASWILNDYNGYFFEVFFKGKEKMTIAERIHVRQEFFPSYKTHVSNKNRWHSEFSYGLNVSKDE